MRPNIVDSSESLLVSVYVSGLIGEFVLGSSMTFRRSFAAAMSLSLLVGTGIAVWYGNHSMVSVILTALVSSHHTFQQR